MPAVPQHVGSEGHWLAPLGWRSGRSNAGRGTSGRAGTGRCSSGVKRLIGNNTRFVVLPEASGMANLASRALSRGLGEAPGHPLELTETFVDPERLRGTCYAASNWTRLPDEGLRAQQRRVHRPARVAEGDVRGRCAPTPGRGSRTTARTAAPAARHLLPLRKPAPDHPWHRGFKPNGGRRLTPRRSSAWTPIRSLRPSAGTAEVPSRTRPGTRARGQLVARRASVARNPIPCGAFVSDREGRGSCEAAVASVTQPTRPRRRGHL